MLQFTTPSTRWAALQSRNPEAANAFVYCVTTTKIYCRPTCPSRLARRANIVFHDKASEAEAEGFRACKRCRPELREGEGDPQKIAVEKACDLVRKEQRGAEIGKWSVKALATEVGLTESHFCRIFKKIIGMTVGEYRASLLPISTRSLTEEIHPGQQDLSSARGQTECCLTPYVPGDYAYKDCQQSADPELANELNCFSRVLPSFLHSATPQMHLNLVDSECTSPKYFSNVIEIDLTDDGFQFLDFDG